MAKPNRKCICCETPYSYCNSCAADRTKPSWYALFDKEECRNIWNVVTTVYARDGVVTAMNELNKFNVDFSTLREDVQRKIKRMQLESGNFLTETVKEVKEVENPVVEESTIEEASPSEILEVLVEDKSEKSDTTEENQDFKKITYNRRRRR